MNMLFVAAAVFLIAISLAHSLLGERLMLLPLFQKTSVELSHKKPYMKPMLRFAWHITTIAWWGLTLVIIDFAGIENPSHLTVHAIAATSIVTALIIFCFSRRRHFAWIVFLAIAGYLWVGM